MSNLKPRHLWNDYADQKILDGVFPIGLWIIQLE